MDAPPHPSASPASVGRTVLWLTIPRPEDVVVIYFLFALTTYILFMILGLGHIITIIMTLVNAATNWVLLLILGSLSAWITRSKRERLGGGGSSTSV